MIQMETEFLTFDVDDDGDGISTRTEITAANCTLIPLMIF
jgi:hypothetical protein